MIHIPQEINQDITYHMDDQQEEKKFLERFSQLALDLLKNVIQSDEVRETLYGQLALELLKSANGSGKIQGWTEALICMKRIYANILWKNSEWTNLLLEDHVRPSEELLKSLKNFSGERKKRKAMLRSFEQCITNATAMSDEVLKEVLDTIQFVQNDLLSDIQTKEENVDDGTKASAGVGVIGDEDVDENENGNENENADENKNSPDKLFISSMKKLRKELEKVSS